MKLYYLQFIKLSTIVVSIILLNGIMVIAQPSNDICSNAISLTIGSTSSNYMWLMGTTLNTEDGSTQISPKSTCSNFANRDDVWYKFSVPLDSLNKFITIRLQKGALPQDIAMFGLAIYASNDCSPDNAPISCINFLKGEDSKLSISAICGQDYLVRVWSSNENETDWKIGQGNFRITAYYDDNIIQEQILWGANGEGSFNGGLNGWTTTSSSCNNYPLWFWSKDTMCTRGKYSKNGGTIASLTACNGAMCFDSDYYDTDGVNGNPGFGDCLAPQSGTLESPIIDLSAYPNINEVSLVFNQGLRQFQSNYFIDYSLDGGVNWITKEINTKEENDTLYDVNGPYVNNQRKIFLPGAGGQSQLKVRFRFEANYYYWIIDDVYITKREKYILKIDSFYAVATNKIWHKDQLEGFGGLANIYNDGSKAATNVELQLNVMESQKIIFTDILNCGDIPAETELISPAMPNSFNFPNKNITNYSAFYDVSTDSPEFAGPYSTQLIKWSVTDSLMSKENSSPIGNGMRPLTDVNFTWGNIYHIVSNKSAVGNELICNHIDVGVANPDNLYGATIFVLVYKWIDANHDGQIQLSEINKIGISQYDFKAGEKANTLYFFPIYDINTFIQGISLENNTDYIVAVKYSAPADNNTLECFICSDASIDYSAHDYRTKLPGFGPIRPSHVLDVGNTGVFKTNTFSGGEVPVIRMPIYEVFPDATKNIWLNQSNKITITPNPVSENLIVKIDLVKESSSVNITVLDISAKIVLQKELNNIKSTTETFNVANLANGTYLLNLSTDAGVRSVKFVVAK